MGRAPDGCVADSTSVSLARNRAAWGSAAARLTYKGEGNGKTWSGRRVSDGPSRSDAGSPSFGCPTPAVVHGQAQARQRPRDARPRGAGHHRGPARPADRDRGDEVRGAQAARQGPEDQAHAQPARSDSPERDRPRRGGRLAGLAPVSAHRHRALARRRQSNRQPRHPAARSSQPSIRRSPSSSSSATPSRACRCTR